jgi:hypothetical protein
MAPRQRIVLLVIAAVVLVGGIALAASSGGDDDGGETSASTQPAAETQAPAGETGAQEEEPAPPPKPRVETIRIQGGAPAGGVQDLRYESGDTIRLRFVSDAPGEVHIHGFDRYVQVGTSPKTTSFKADLEGIFEVEEHGSGEILAKLQIRPQ